MPTTRLRHLAIAACLACVGCTINVAGIPAGMASHEGSPGPSGKPVVAASPGSHSGGGVVASQVTGSITGFVYGQGGNTQPIPLAKVTVGSVTTTAGNPDLAKAVNEDNEFDRSEDAIKPHFDVMHDFNDGVGPVPCERERRKTPLELPATASDSDRTRAAYAYLRAGEFLVEGVPEGQVQVSASFGGVTATPIPVAVLAGKETSGVTISLALPESVVADNGKPVHVLEWAGLTPSTGVTMKLVNQVSTAPDGTTTHTVALQYSPDPPDVVITLKAPPGSSGATIKAASIIYQYNTASRQAEGKPPQEIGPIQVQLTPVKVEAAQDAGYGPTASLTVPVGAPQLQQVFNVPDPSNLPGQITANVQFIDDTGAVVMDRTLSPLEAGVNIRTL